jgi:Peptidase family C25
MKRAAPITILVLFAMLFNITLFGQKSRSVTGVSIKESATIKDTAEGGAVRFQNVEAYSDGQGAWLSWTMALETRNFGFYVYRVNGGQKQLVSNSMVPGSAARIGNEPVTGTQYSYYDLGGAADSVYVIESEDVSGRVYTSAQANVKIVSDLTPLAGYSSDFLAAQRQNATGMGATDGPSTSSDSQAKMSSKQLTRAMDTQRALVAQDGVKFAIRKSGMYRVTRAQLEAAGFDVNSDPANWQLFAKGIQQGINVGGAGDYIEFYGKAINEIESDTQFYYLIAGAGPGLRMGTRNIQQITSLTSANFQETAVRAPKSVYINTILNGDNTNFFGPGIGSSAPTTINFSLFGLDVSNRRNPVTIEIQGFSLASHSVGVVLNGLTLPPITGSFDTKYSRSYVVSPGFLREGNNTLELISQTSGDANLFSSITIDYRRKYIAENNQLLYLNENFREVDINGFASANTRIFDLTDDSNPIMMTGTTVTPSGGGFSIHIPQYRARIMLGVEDSGLLQPASITRNFASNLATSGHDADLVIISYKDWMTEAGVWADYRRTQGFDVEVVDIDDIYDEFNFGTHSNGAITAFLHYAKKNWNTPPGYVLLLGDASYDPRNFEGNGFFDYVPSKIVNTLYSEVPSDDALVDFNHDGLADISIGRIPGRSASAMTIAYNRMLGFEQPAMQTLSRGVVFASDQPNGYDFRAMGVRIGDELPPGTPITHINRDDANAPTALIEALNAGPYLANYSGHGTVGVWAVSPFFGNTRVPELRNNEKLTIYTLLTCLNGYFINPTSPVSLGENLLFARWTDNSGPAPVTHDVGAIATWASTGLTVPPDQETMARRFYKQIGQVNPTLTRLGDLTRDAKGVLVGGEDVRNSWVLLGDPMLQVRQAPAP